VHVALFCYMVAIAFAGMAWKEREMSPVEASVVSVLSFASLAVIEIRLGSLLGSQSVRAPLVFARDAPKKARPDSATTVSSRR
jgi:hypothetical protein